MILITFQVRDSTSNMYLCDEVINQAFSTWRRFGFGLRRDGVQTFFSFLLFPGNCIKMTCPGGESHHGNVSNMKAIFDSRFFLKLFFFIIPETILFLYGNGTKTIAQTFPCMGLWLWRFWCSIYDDNLMAGDGEISQNCDTLLGLIKTSFV